MHFGKKSNATPERRPLAFLGPRDAKRVAVGVTVLVIIMAVLVVLFSNPAAQGVDACNGILLKHQRYSCLASLALRSGNESMCGSIGDTIMHDSCVLSVAENTRNTSKCAGINATSYDYVYCVLNVGKDYETASYCSKLQEPYGSQCSYDFAMRTGYVNGTICGDISNSTLGALCDNMTDFVGAISIPSAARCASLPASNDTLLMEAMASYNTANTTFAYLSAVGYQRLNITPRDYCYITVANATMNSSICALTGDSIAEQACNATASPRNSTPVHTNATAACASVPSYLKDGCIYSVIIQNAVGFRNLSACEGISQAQYRDSCFAALANQYSNASYCGYISNVSTRNNCTISST